MRAGQHARLFLVERRALHVALLRGRLGVRLHVALVLVRRDLERERVVGSYHHVRRSVQRVGPRRVHGQRVFAADEREIDLGAFAPPDPVALLLLRLGPVQIFQIRGEPVGVGRDAELPLAQRLAHHREVAALAAAVDDLFVRQHRAQLRAPVHGDFRLERQPAIEELQEDPLRPLEVPRVRRVHLARPVVGKAQHLELAAEHLDVLVGGDGRMRAGVDGVLLGGQPESVPAHRVQHVEATHPLVAADDVRRRVALGMTHVQARPGRIRKHVERVELRPPRVALRPERRVPFPVRLPARLDRSMVVGHEPLSLANPPRAPPPSTHFGVG